MIIRLWSFFCCHLIGSVAVHRFLHNDEIDLPSLRMDSFSLQYLECIRKPEVVEFMGPDLTVLPSTH